MGTFVDQQIYDKNIQWSGWLLILALQIDIYKSNLLKSDSISNYKFV